MIIDFSTVGKLLFDAGSAAHNSGSGLPYPAGAGAGAGSTGNTSGNNDNSIGKTIADYVYTMLKDGVKNKIEEQHNQTNSQSDK